MSSAQRAARGATSSTSSARPLRVDAIVAAASSARPLESPTTAVTNALTGLGSSDRSSPTLGVSSSSGPMPPPAPPPRPGAASSSGLRQRRSASIDSEVSALLADAPAQAAAPADEGRASLSPNKRRRNPADDGEGPALADSDAADSTPSPAQERGRPESPTKRQARFKPVGKSSKESSLQPSMRVIDIFAPGMMDGMPVFRIPALLCLPGGVVLAFSEARPGWQDSGNIDLVMRRSTDSGRTWGGASVVVDSSLLRGDRSATVGNPTAVYDAETGVVWLFLCSNHEADVEWQIHANEGLESRRVWVTSSSDQGKSWSQPKDLSSSLKHRSWTWYATGPGNGVQLSSGRLLIPANHAEDVHEPNCPYLVERRRSRMVAHCIYSDDHGKTWRLGGCAARHTNECCIAALSDGRAMLNARDWSGAFTRVVQLSSDGGATWGAARHDEILIEPEPQGCEGSILALPPLGSNDAKGGKGGKGGKGKGDGILFFCNPACERREMLTVRRSDDCGTTWATDLVLEEGPSAYSSMALLGDGQ